MPRLKVYNAATGNWEYINVGVPLDLRGAAGGTDLITARITGDSLPRWTLNADGSMEWASGAAGADVTLSHPAANILQIPTGDRMLYPPHAALLEKGSSQSINNATWTALTFDLELMEDWGWHSTVSNTDRVTVDKAGTYLAVGYYLISAHAGTFDSLGFVVNGPGTPNVQFQQPNSATISKGYSGSECIYEVNAGDYIQMEVYQNSGGAVNVLAAQLLVHYIGDYV